MLQESLRPFPLRVHISTLFIVLVLAVGSLIGWLGYSFSRDQLETSAAELISRINRETLTELNLAMAPAETAISLVRYTVLVSATSHDERMSALPLLVEALGSSNLLSSIYVGYGNGDFFFVRKLQDAREAAAFDAPPGARYIVQSIEQGTTLARGRYVHLDAALAVLRTDELPDYAAAYDPRGREWYRSALVASGRVVTSPYVFFSSRRVGTTMAVRVPDHAAVVGADILLETLSVSLAKQKVTPGTELALADAGGGVVAYEQIGRLLPDVDDPAVAVQLARLGDLGVPALQQVSLPLSAERGGQAVMVGDAPWRMSIAQLHIEGAPALFLVTAVPESELFADALRLRRQSAMLTALVILIAIPVTWSMARGIAGPLQALVGNAEAVQRFDFSRTMKVNSLVKEVNELAATMEGMKRNIRRFLDISLAVAAEKRFEDLLPRLLVETVLAADAAGGVLYLVEDDRLVPAAALKADGTPLPGTAASLPLDGATSLLGRALETGIALAAGLDAEALRILGLQAAAVETDAAHAIAVPLLNRQGQQVGAMLLLRREESDRARLSFIEALSGSTALSLENKALINAQKVLFESFIQLIAGAIDAKSPYTGGHCARVPELTKMLARAACDAGDGVFRDFRLDEDEWEAVHVAAWLHDCGKVTTPEYVVDKATKLETLYNRIHEVRMRFEVLKRDAEIECLKAMQGGTPELEARARLVREWALLDEEFAFVASCNEGGESMAPAQIERLEQIARRSWLRTLDDRLGTSYEERLRMARVPVAPLPVRECLLADKPEHMFERSEHERIAPDNRWGFRMEVPELLYNRGELYNLSVERGTLSAEERYKINEHIVQTQIMLAQLPFPRHLREVPEIAGGHHEKMDGTGYPKRLTREQMSPVARMMAIADIFEALTAVDRPYKRGKTLSESIAIMARMRDEHHIDPDLFELFLRSGVYRDYAEHFMQQAQIDAVRIEDYLYPAQA
ncbi:MAG: HD domain-containing phosphohydrolase [Azoarcus sp.]|nr:HD domain-containing phosphohydrolase [Azoarcus sp.]